MVALRLKELLARMSMRTQMLGIALAALLPMAMLAAYQIADEVTEARETIAQIATTIAWVNAAEIARTLDVTRHFLELLSKDEGVRALDPARCGHLFDHFPKLYPYHSNLLSKDLSGHPVCSALPLPPGTTVIIDNYLDAVRKSDGFAIGLPNLGPVSKRWVVPLDYPLRDDAGRIVGTIAAPLDLIRFNPFIGAQAFHQFPEGTVATLFSSDMSILARSIDPEKWIGSGRVDPPVLVELLNRRSGTARFVSVIDRVERIWAAAPVDGTDWTMLAGIPTTYLNAQLSALIRKWVMIGFGASLMSLALAYWMARKTAQPLLAVAAIAKQVGAGDTSVRAEPMGNREVVNFAKAFNAMLDGLEERRRDLADSEERYHCLFSRAKVVMLLIDPLTGQIVDANQAAALYYGWDIETLKTMRMSQINTLPEDRVLTEMALTLDERDHHFLFFHRLASGEVRDVDVHAAVMDVGGRSLLFSIVHDVTARRRLERERHRLVMAIEQSPATVMIASVDGTIEYVNPAFTRFTGYDRDEVTGQNPRLLKSGLTPIEDYQAMWAALTAGRTWVGLFCNRRKDGTLYWENTRISPVIDDAGKISSFVAVKEDVTAQREAEHAIRDLSRRLQDLLAAASEVSIIAIDTSGLITLFNRGAERMLGYSAEEMVGKMTPLSFHAEDEVAAVGAAWSSELGRPVAPFEGLVLTAAREGRDLQQCTYIRKDGSRLIVSLAITPVRSDSGEITGYLGIAVDITESKMLELDLKRTNAELEQFAYVASHDLRQPLRMVTSYMGLIEAQLGESLSGDLKTYFAFAMDGARRMDLLISDLLQYSRTGRASEAVPVALSDTVAQALFTLTAEVNEAKAEITVADNLPEIQADPNEWIRLFQNLIGNALKYRAPDHPLRVEIGWRKQAKEIILWVKDNGIGIAPKDHDRAFMVFQRLVAREVCEGTGIGLAICKKIVERQGGRIWIESDVGKGAAFFIALPIRGGRR